MITLSVLGLAGCAMVLVALIADWRFQRRAAYWTFSGPVGLTVEPYRPDPTVTQ